MSRLVRVSMRFVAISLVVATIMVDGSVTEARASGGRDAHVTVSQSGIHIFAVNGRPYEIRTAIHVLTFAGSQYSLAVGLAHNLIDGGLERPSSMCQNATGCVAAINADFFDLTPTSAPDPGDEVGGIVQDCVLLHTPQISHQQVDLDNHVVSNGLNWKAALTLNGTSIPIAAINQQLPLSYANVSLPLAGTLLYTAPYAFDVPVRANRTIYEFTQADPTTSPTTINSTSTLTFAGSTTQSIRVGNGQVFISALSNSVLAALQPGNVVSLTTTSSAGCNDVGGHPILINQGVVQPVIRADTYMIKPYARSVIGWTQSGVPVLMTVDGTDLRSGATAYQLDHVLESLGVVTALDLDGGNSSTLYAQGRVVNKPSKGTEHPVSTSVLVISNPSASG